MKKKVITIVTVICALSMLCIFMTGCEGNVTPTPTHTPSPPPSATPPAATFTPGTTDNMTEEPGMSPNHTDELGTGEPEGTGIPDFVEGTVVDISTVPELVAAVMLKYPGATVTKITHKLHQNEQVYEVELKDATGAEHTIHVRHHDHSIIEP